MKITSKIAASFLREQLDGRRLRLSRKEAEPAAATKTAEGARETPAKALLDVLDKLALDGSAMLTREEADALASRVDDLSADVLSKLRYGRREDALSALSELRVRRAALQQALQTNDHLLPQELIDFLH